MAARPTHIDLRGGSFDETPRPPRPPFHLDLPSPRTGEAPPALSPLDAFAMHSRLLARRFEDPSGKRISRLPARDVAKELANRPGYFATWNHGNTSEMGDLLEVNEEPATTTSTAGLEVMAPDANHRPKSHYPMFGNVERQDDEVSLGAPFYDTYESQKSERDAEQSFFGFAAPRALSPEPVDPKTVNIAPPTPNMPSLTSSVDSLQSSQPPRTRTNGSGRSYHALAPPRSPAFPKSPRSFQSIRSVRADSGDEDNFTTSSQPMSSRKFSGSSNMSRPQSPLSPWMPAVQRSPSMNSDFSAGGSQMPPRPMNFSRPMSSASNRPVFDARPSLDSRSSFETRPSTDLPLRWQNNQTQGTSLSGSSRQASEDDLTPPHNALPESDSTAELDGLPPIAPASYTYAKFTLPRGRTVDRLSGLRESWIQRQFTWDELKPAEETKPREQLTGDSDELHDLTARPPSAGSAILPQERQERIGRERAASSANRSRSAGPRPFSFENSPKTSLQRAPSGRTHHTDSTDQTIKPAKQLHERATSTELTPEAHLEIGIQAHSRGELNKSTYHLRLAARAGLPTAMLLYALACRHGWGMRPNQADGVMWLRKAIEHSGIETTDVDVTLATASTAIVPGSSPNPSTSANSKSTSSKPADPKAEALERRKRKAQFALAIYELGISYMNGWGCAKDRALAVRCYEIAGAWGDCDALAEAGFAYTQGLGVKKDLKKAASYYRKAADGGMSMAGNSWIYKSKYMDDSSKTPEKDKDKKSQQSRPETGGGAQNKDLGIDDVGAKTPTRPRARSIWGRNKKEK